MNLFLIILNMSITASFVALAVIIARLLLKRAPKIFSYILWVAVAIRLITPVSFASSFSILHLVKPQDTTGTGFMEFVPEEIGMKETPIVDVGIKEVNHFINSSLPVATATASVNPMQIIIWIASVIWISGVVILLLYSIISYLKILVRVRTATLVKDNIYETDQIATPFVLGFINPKIYIPIDMSDHELSYILLHEQIHIKRRDYLIKPLAFMMLIIHWFNPLMWLSYALMSKDMEMSCDESVVNKMGNQIKRSYSTSLLTLAVKKGLPTGSPLAFGESNVKARIKNILTYRQASKRTIAAYMLVIVALVVGCTANPKPQQSLHGYNIDQLMENKTLYVGNATKVGGLINGMPNPTDSKWNMALQTKAQPYGVTINYVMNDSNLGKEEEIKGEVFHRNAILLLGLIDNVDSITCSIVDSSGQSDDIVNSYTFTREQVDKIVGEDVRHFASDEKSLRQLINRLDSMPFSGNSKNP
ncbi:M56 family metallopeptidase [Lysinibacillus sp. NPDC058147]|uniref:M56 family metallopeptidase n=1 Tax=unclassified Lysinibacillus TaxID=2636778 RepID=UPI0036DE8231